MPNKNRFLFSPDVTPQELEEVAALMGYSSISQFINDAIAAKIHYYAIYEHAREQTKKERLRLPSQRKVQLEADIKEIAKADYKSDFDDPYALHKDEEKE